MVRKQRWTRTSICFKWSEKRKQILPKGWFISDLPWQKAKENFTPQKIQVCNIPSLPTSSKYLVSRCWDPLKVFSGGICGSKHLLRRYLEDLTRVCIDENHVNVNINTAVIYQQMCRTANTAMCYNGCPTTGHSRDEALQVLQDYHHQLGPSKWGSTLAWAHEKTHVSHCARVAFQSQRNDGTQNELVVSTHLKKY